MPSQSSKTPSERSMISGSCFRYVATPCTSTEADIYSCAEIPILILLLNLRRISNTTYIQPRMLWNESSRDISGLRGNIGRELDRRLRSSRGWSRRQSDCFLSWSHTGGFRGVFLIGDSGHEIVPEFGMERGLVAEMHIGDISGHISRFLS